MKLGVWNDYGRLREVAVGMAENAVVPGYSDAFPPFAQELTRKYAGQPADSVPGLDEMMALTQGQARSSRTGLPGSRGDRPQAPEIYEGRIRVSE